MSDPLFGLCSVTLRQLSPDQVIRAARTAGLGKIEWGADVHAPAGDDAMLSSLRTDTIEAGLKVCSYGSYWKAGVTGAEQVTHDLDAAVALGAPRMRVWAADTGSERASGAMWENTVHDLQVAADLAEQRGLTLALEFHPGTLADTAESTLRLLDLVGAPNISSYWQPPVGMSTPEALEGLAAIVDVVSAVHVFSWWPDAERVPLETRSDLWASALAMVATRAPAADVLLEFVPGDSPEALCREAETLRRLASAAGLAPS